MGQAPHFGDEEPFLRVGALPGGPQPVQTCCPGRGAEPAPGRVDALWPCAVTCVPREMTEKYPALMGRLVGRRGPCTEQAPWGAVLMAFNPSGGGRRPRNMVQV